MKRALPAVPLAALVLLSGLVSGLAPAQEGPPSYNDSSGRLVEGDRKVVYLTVRHAVALALRNNHDISLSQIDPRLAATDEMAALSAFDPTIFGDLEFERLRRPSPKAGAGALTSLLGGTSTGGQERVEWSAGIRNRWQTGTQLEFRFNARETKPLGGGGGGGGILALFGGAGGTETQYETEAIAVVTQPLLRNFGFGFNLADTRLARNNRIITAHALEDQIRQTIDSTLQTYWDLVFAVENRELQQESLRRAERFLQIARAQQAKNEADPLAVLQAQVEVARVQGEILQAEQDLGDVEDLLKRLIMPDNLSFEAGAILVPTEKPTLEQVSIDQQESIRVALMNRPDVLAARARIRNSRIEIDRATNQLLPLVNLTAAGGYFGLDDNLGDSTDEIHDLESPLWRVGVEIEFPLGNRAARAQFDRSRLELRRNQIALDSIEKQVVVEVREAIRQIRTSQKQIATTHQARQLSEQQLEAETLRFERGLNTSNKVLLDFQEDLTRARLQELQAFTSYKKARIRLESSMGSQIRDYLRLAPLPAGYRHLED